jgi:uncharacterized membrane protein
MDLTQSEPGQKRNLVAPAIWLPIIIFAVFFIIIIVIFHVLRTIRRGRMEQEVIRKQSNTDARKEKYKENDQPK